MRRAVNVECKGGLSDVDLREGDIGKHPQPPWERSTEMRVEEENTHHREFETQNRTRDGRGEGKGQRREPLRSLGRIGGGRGGL